MSRRRPCGGEDVISQLLGALVAVRVGMNHDKASTRSRMSVIDCSPTSSASVKCASCCFPRVPSRAPLDDPTDLHSVEVAG